RSALPVAITSGPAGYRIETEHITTDVDTFLALCAEGEALAQQEEHDSAAAAFREALRLWNGPVLAGVPESVGIRSFRLRLNEARRDAETNYADAALQAGNPEEVVALLSDRIRSDPLHERTHTQYITALEA